MYLADCSMKNINNKINISRIKTFQISFKTFFSVLKLTWLFISHVYFNKITRKIFIITLILL